MKNILLSSIFAFATTSLFAQNGPIDFEPNGHGASWVWTVFENDTQPPLEIVANPDPTGINTSATVAKYTALQAGNPWAGCETLHGAGTGSFFIDASNAIVRIMVWKSVVSDVGIKLVRPDGWSLGEIKISNTLTNKWEQLTYDFSAHIGLTPAYEQLVVFPDFPVRFRTTSFTLTTSSVLQQVHLPAMMNCRICPRVSFPIQQMTALVWSPPSLLRS